MRAPVLTAGATLLATLFAAVLWLGSAGPAHAHAALVAVEPADGAVVARAPATFALTFSEPTSPLVLKLVRPDGTGTVLDRFTLRDSTLDIEAPGDLGPGTYVLSWRVVSEDGHPVGGSAVFSIGSPSLRDGAAPQEAADWPLLAAIWAARTVLYAGLFIGIGGVFFQSWIGDRNRFVVSVLAATLVAGFVAAVLSVGLLGLDGLDLPLGSILTRPPWQTGAATRFGLTAVIAAAALAVALAVILAGAPAAPRVRRGIGRVAAAAALVGVGLALAVSGHAGSASPQWLTRPAVFLHTVGIAFWAGALLPLGAALASGPSAAPVLGRFSRAIPIALYPLLAAGLLLAVVQLGHLDALWTTAYGRVLLVKLLLVAGLLALAAVNRLRLTAPAGGGEAVARRALRRSIRIEIVLVLAIFAVAALWRFTPPPRALALAEAAPASVHIHTQKAMADVTITPGHAGPVAVAIMLMTGDFGPLDAKGLTVVFSNAAAGIEGVKREAHKGPDAIWRVDDLNLPVAGRWQVRLDILVSDFELVKITDAIDIRR